MSRCVDQQGGAPLHEQPDVGQEGRFSRVRFQFRDGIPFSAGSKYNQHRHIA